jgi:integrase
MARTGKARGVFRRPRPQFGGCGCKRESCDACYKPGWYYYHRTTARHGGSTKIAATKARDAAINTQRADEALGGALNLKAAVKATRRVRLSAWLAEWYATHVQAGTAWAASLDSHVSRLLRHFTADPYLDEIRASDCVGLVRALRSELGDDYVRKIFGTFSAALRWAVSDELIAKNPAAKADVRRAVPAKPRAKPRFLTRAQLSRLVSAAKNGVLCVRGNETVPHPWLWQVIVTAASTGARRGELLDLRWRDVDFGGGWVYLSSEKGARHSERAVPLLAETTEALKSLPRGVGDALVFGLDGRRVQSFGKAFNSACRRAQLGRVGFHALRHTYASLLVQDGRTLQEVRDLLGHSTIRLTEVYAHLTEGSAKRTVEGFTLGLEVTDVHV